MIELEVEFIYETDDAIRILSLTTDVADWLPKILIVYDTSKFYHKGDVFEMEIPKEMAYDKGLI